MREALAFFEAAVSLEKRFNVKDPQARYLSYYGLCLSKTRSKRHEAVRCCKRATRIERYNPDLYLNLSHTLLAAGFRGKAHEAVISGLRQEPKHTELRRQLARLGHRQRLTVPFLSRSNPINVFFGRQHRAAARKRKKRT
ncbi:MAG: hypothetical protein OEV00_03905 [Acidobacteriota bacterium]|nr:hypothetical protein [Acidobacteriota bacterium]MDH3784456.1 hypothetical protein [Acidobacteriota bacterium]